MVLRSGGRTSTLGQSVILFSIIAFNEIFNGFYQVLQTAGDSFKDRTGTAESLFHAAAFPSSCLFNVRQRISASET